MPGGSGVGWFSVASVQGSSMHSAQADSFALAHARLLADKQIQFGLPASKPPVLLPWLRALAALLDQAWPVIRILVWIGLGALALALLWMLIRRMLAAGWFRRGHDEDATAADEAEWRPAAAPARRLLAEADALAGAGRYGEAARLVLQRSVEDIETYRPGLVHPATTSRDLAAAPELPAAARPAFTLIAHVVEMALFADRGATAEAWNRARGAYADFALDGNWR